MTNRAGRPWKIQSIQRCPGQEAPCRFAVVLERGGRVVAEIKVEASELLDYRAFQEHVLKASGCLVRLTVVEGSPNPAVAWLDLVEAALPDEPLRGESAGFCPSPPARRPHPQDAMQEIGGGD